MTAIHDIMNTDNITVPSDKNVIFDLDGHDFRSSKSIVNNGTFTITNNSDETSLLRFFGSDYYIVNNEGASLTLSNIEIESNKILKNSASATVIINNVPFTANDVAIYNLGALNATTATITSSGSYAIYSSSAESSAVNGATITGYVLNNSGTLDFANSTLSRTVQSYGRETYANKGQSTLDNVTISLATLSADNRDSSNSVINNSGTMTIKSNSSVSATINTSNIKNYSINNSGTLTVDHSTINAERSSTSSRYGSYGLYNTGNATLKDSAIVVNDPTTAYGIYSNAGIAAIETGTITASSVTAYGAYINGGEVTAGVPEVVGSPTYGHDTANVSITNPLIYAIGTSTGIGIKNANGSFNYYDGKLMGSTAAKPEIPTKIEYLYEAFDYVDSETGHPYCILEWMREQP